MGSHKGRTPKWNLLGNPLTYDMECPAIWKAVFLFHMAHFLTPDTGVTASTKQLPSLLLRNISPHRETHPRRKTFVQTFSNREPFPRWEADASGFCAG